MVLSIASGRTRQVLCLAGFAVLALAAHLLTLHAGYRTLEKYEPDWTTIGLVRLTVSAVAALLLMAALRQFGGQQPVQGDLPGWLFVAMWTASFLLLYAAALAVIYWPDQLEHHVREGDFLSIMTEVLFVAALVFLCIAARRARHVRTERLFGLGAPLIIMAIAAVAFIVLMEEASWGQHWIGWATPGIFEGNLQNETNLHNFYTYRFEMAYYSAAIIAFVLLPYAWPAEPPRALRGASLFVPPPLFAVAFLPLSGFMYFNWNWVFFGIWFVASLFIAVDIARRATGPGTVSGSLVMGAMLVVSQLIFLMRGDTLAWGHELTEVREFAIAIGVLGYSATLWRRVVALPARSAESGAVHPASVPAPAPREVERGKLRG